jgi:hypothetical protein
VRSGSKGSSPPERERRALNAARIVRRVLLRLIEKFRPRDAAQ